MWDRDAPRAAPPAPPPGCYGALGGDPRLECFIRPLSEGVRDERGMKSDEHLPSCSSVNTNTHLLREGVRGREEERDREREARR